MIANISVCKYYAYTGSRYPPEGILEIFASEICIYAPAYLLSTAAWSSGMILASGARGPGLNS